MKRLKWYHTLTLVALVAQGAYALTSVVVEGRDLIEVNGIDTRRPNVGEHVITGDMPGRYPFPSTAVNLSAYSEGGSADNGWAWAECLDENGKVGVDSVQIVNGAGGPFTGQCAQVLAVNRAEFRGGSANTGGVRFHSANGGTDSTSIYAQIEPYQVKAEQVVWRVARHHNNSSRPIQGMRIQSLEITAIPAVTFSGGQSAVGSWAITYRDSGGNWRNYASDLFRADGTPRVYTFEAIPTMIGRLAEVAVAVGLTSSATIGPADVRVRMRAVEQ